MNIEDCPFLETVDDIDSILKLKPRSPLFVYVPEALRVQMEGVFSFRGWSRARSSYAIKPDPRSKGDEVHLYWLELTSRR
jgi:hypothetical protein